MGPKGLTPNGLGLSVTQHSCEGEQGERGEAQCTQTHWGREGERSKDKGTKQSSSSLICRCAHCVLLPFRTLSILTLSSTQAQVELSSYSNLLSFVSTKSIIFNILSLYILHQFCFSQIAHQNKCSFMLHSLRAPPAFFLVIICLLYHSPPIA